MYLILKHYVLINKYNVYQVINNEVDAIALIDILNRNNVESNVKYILSKVIR